ncbi:hypothetical protein VB834_14935 [Limnoraphis robusta Tam1]|uniref:hypothetical protein n=1 Tax=Limnoraphis robusta TaxID=1118279 RepID=UPI002B1F0C65|nr:hypothetical protein [Limnoraphis robusta]MEA5498294.1 hypothetical protein [Limnoraphis robusta BA-68 BA1]MEA5540318.1 hypothetical protein [Limnoraphis robusta Tam1]
MGNGGNLNIRANDIELTGISANTQSPSGLFTLVERRAEGDGGNISLDTRRLVVQNGAQIGLETTSMGNAGELNIQADEIKLIGVSEIREVSEDEFARTPSTIFAVVVDTSGTGNGGDLIVNARTIELVGTSRHGQIVSGFIGSAQRNSSFLEPNFVLNKP